LFLGTNYWSLIMCDSTGVLEGLQNSIDKMTDQLARVADAIGGLSGICIGVPVDDPADDTAPAEQATPATAVDVATATPVATDTPVAADTATAPAVQAVDAAVQAAVTDATIATDATAAVVVPAAST
jgi:hypothetical protein